MNPVGHSSPDQPRGQLSVEEVEQRLRTALEASATTQVPADGPPPALDLRGREGRPNRPVLLVAAAAAAVLAVAVGTLLTFDGRDRASSVPATAVPTPSATPSETPSPSGTATPSPTPTASATPTATSPQPTTIGTATLVVPDGWTLWEDVPDESGVGPIGRQWCLDPADGDGCVISVTQMDDSRNPLNSDLEGGYESNPHYCDPGTRVDRELVGYRDEQVGGRDGEYRQWRWTCEDGLVHNIAQYTVVTPEAWTVKSESATTPVREVMAEVVASLRLQPPSSSMRLYDHGIVRSVEDAPGGTIVVHLDRVVIGAPNSNSATYTYRAPADISSGREGTLLRDLTGHEVSLFTDGRLVTRFQR